MRSGSTRSEVETQNVGLGLLPAVVSGRADAMLGGFRNVEGVDLAERGLKPRVVPVDELGIPTYDELVLVANSDQVEEDPEAIRLFIAALEQGTLDAVRDPEAATDAVLAAGDGLDPKLTAAEIEATLPLLLPESGNRPYGYMNAARVGGVRRLPRRRGRDHHAPGDRRRADERPPPGRDPGIGGWLSFLPLSGRNDNDP